MKKLIIQITLLLSIAIGVAYASVVEFSGVTPTQREDGTALGLSEIAGFNIYYGAEVGDYQQSIYIAGATLPETAWQLELPDGTHYAVVTAVDIDGRQSLYSNMVTLVVDAKALPKPPMITAGQIIRITATLP